MSEPLQVFLAMLTFLFANGCLALIARKLMK